MSKFEKLIQRLLTYPKDFSYDEITRVFRDFGYTEEQGSGSIVVFTDKRTGHSIKLHKPHPGKILKRYQIELIIKELKSRGFI